jgi:DNA polymerase III delta prime subunit
MPEAPLPRDIDPAVGRLAAEMPNLRGALTWLQAGLALRQACGVPTTRIAPLLLVGPPGVGKTRFVRRLAAELGLRWGRLSLEGLSDNRTLAGTSSGWSTAEPAWPVGEIARLGVANPLLMLDELDKCSSSHNGDPLATLLGWLEPSTSAAVVDPVLGASVDLSGISWILAANRIDRLPAPLLGRAHVVHVDLLPLDAFDTVLAGVLADIAEELGVPDARLLPPLETAEITLLQRMWKQTRTPRLLRRVVERLLGAASMRPSGSPH